MAKHSVHQTEWKQIYVVKPVITSNIFEHMFEGKIKARLNIRRSQYYAMKV